MIRRMYKRLTTSTARWWLLAGALLGASALPCPECGAPMIFHFGPIAGMVLVVRALKKRHRQEQGSAGHYEGKGERG